MVDKDKPFPAKKNEDTSTDDQGSPESVRDGMNTASALLSINKNLRKRIMEDYDLVSIENKGRYYAARAYSKDRRWLYELLIDKQTDTIRIVNQTSIK